MVMMSTGMSSGQDIYHLLVCLVGNKKGLVLFYMNRVPFFQHKIISFRGDMHRACYRDEYFFMSRSGFNQPVSLIWPKDPIDHITGVGV